MPRGEGRISTSASARSASSDPTPDDAGGSAQASAKLPAPEQRKTFNSSVKRGAVTVRCPGDDRFRGISGDNDLNMRCLIDTRKGQLEITTSAGGGKTQSALFYEGIFKVGQTRGRKPVTELTLAGRLQTGSWAPRFRGRATGPPSPSPALGARPRAVPDAWPARVGLRARDHLAGGGPLGRHHLLQGDLRPGRGARFRPAQDHHPAAGQGLYSEAAPPAALSRFGHGRIHTAAFLAVGLAAVALALTAYFTDMLESPELSTVDTRFDVRGDQDKPRDIAVVGVDDVTFDELRQQWPFPVRCTGRRSSG